MLERYSRNIPAISEKEQDQLKEKRVFIAGCGGLGGNIIENLVRMGIGHITAIDGDVFEASNLNRQLLSSEAAIGYSKAETAAKRAAAVNSDIDFRVTQTFLTEENAEELISGHDLVIDALDNVPARLWLEDACEKQNITIIHGAILGWNVQAAVVPPGSRLLHQLYQHGASSQKTSLPFTPAFCAAIESAEAVKYLCGRESDLSGKLLLADLQSLEWDIISLV